MLCTREAELKLPLVTLLAFYLGPLRWPRWLQSHFNIAKMRSVALQHASCGRTACSRRVQARRPVQPVGCTARVTRLYMALHQALEAAPAATSSSQQSGPSIPASSHTEPSRRALMVSFASVLAALGVHQGGSVALRWQWSLHARVDGAAAACGPCSCSGTCCSCLLASFPCTPNVVWCFLYPLCRCPCSTSGDLRH